MRLFVSILLLGGAAAGLPPKNDDWSRVETRNFVLVGNAPVRTIRSVALDLELFRQVLIATSTNMYTGTPVETTIYVFRNEKSFRPYKLGPDGRPDDLLTGYFIGAEDGIYVALDASAREGPASVVYHEYVHFWLLNNIPSLPLWLDEGIAEFYSTFEAHGDEAEVGRPVESHIQWLRNGPLLALDDLFRVTTGSADYNEGDRRGTLYAQSWALAHYLLMAEPGHAQKMGFLLGRIADGDDPRTALFEIYETDEERLERELELYVRARSYRFIRHSFAKGLEAAEASVRQLERKEVLFLLGDLLAHRNPLPEDVVAEHLNAAISLDPGYGAPHTSFGLVAMATGQREAGEAHLLRAVELDPSSQKAHWLYGQALVERFDVESFDRNIQIGKIPPTLLAAREPLRRSLQLAPGHPQTLAALGKTYLYDTDPSQAIAILEEAWAALPSRADIIEALVRVLARSGDRPRAQQLVAILEQRSGPGAEWTAESARVTADLTEVAKLWSAGLVDEAKALLNHTVASVRDPARREALVARLPSFERLEVVRRESVRYDEAVAASEAGDDEHAMSILEDLVATATSPVVTDLARDLIGRIEQKRQAAAHFERYEQAVGLANEGRWEDAIELLRQLLSEELHPALDEAMRQTLAEIEAVRP